MCHVHQVPRWLWASCRSRRHCWMVWSVQIQPATLRVVLPLSCWRQWSHAARAEMACAATRCVALELRQSIRLLSDYRVLFECAPKMTAVTPIQLRRLPFIFHLSGMPSLAGAAFSR